jgi:hypothetical protein
LYDWLCNKERKLHPDGGSELLRRLEGTAFDCRVDHPNLVHEECRTSRALLDGMSCPNVYDGGIGTGEEVRSGLRRQAHLVCKHGQDSEPLNQLVELDIK